MPALFQAAAGCPCGKKDEDGDGNGGNSAVNGVSRDKFGNGPKKKGKANEYEYHELEDAEGPPASGCFAAAGDAGFFHFVHGNLLWDGMMVCT